MTGLSPLGPGAVHMVVDMQRVFADQTEWHLPAFDSIVPNIARIAEAMPGRNLFTRFVVPHTADHAVGRWQNYYRRWHNFTGAVMAPELIEVVDALASYATPETLIDKLTFGAFEAPSCTERLAALNADTILFTGVETDMCVLATLLTAVDRGYRVVAVSDALASTAMDSHQAILDLLLTRLPEQIDIATTDEVLAALDA
jgi:nicotinamidase-related amidase